MNYLHRRRATLFTLLPLADLVVLLIGGALPAAAQKPIEVLPAGALTPVANPAPSTWAMSGYEIARVRVTVGGLTPIMRTELWDARLVAILNQWADHDLEWNRVREIGGSNVIHCIEWRHFEPVASHYYLLMKVTPEDAKAEGTSVMALAARWGKSARHALDYIEPLHPPFGP